MRKIIIQEIILTIISWVETIILYNILPFNKVPVIIYICDIIYPIVTLLLITKSCNKNKL